MLKTRNLFIIFVLIVLLTAVSCKKEKGNGEKIIAKVGKTSLTVDDFLQQVPAQILIQTSAENRKALLENWVANEILYKDALKKDLINKPEIQEKIEQFKKQLLTRAYLQEILAEVQFVSDLEARGYFENHKEEYSSIVEVSHISSNSRQQAEEVLSKLKQGASFTTVAKEYSTDSETAQNGGYLGSFRIGELAAYPLFEKAVFNLKKPGQISDIVETEFNYDIIKLHSRKKTDVNYEDVSQSIILRLRTDRFQKRSEALVDSLKKVYSYEIYPEVLEKEMGITPVAPSGFPAPTTEPSEE
jgi:EpsD family peptidyl-prolyl cis-trans isomerase